MNRSVIKIPSGEWAILNAVARIMKMQPVSPVKPANACHGTLTREDFRKLCPEIAPALTVNDISSLANLMGPEEAGNPQTPAGYTYLGQFIDHDMTFTKEDGMNGRTPILDLDSVYGKGPVVDVNRFQRSSNRNFLFKIGTPVNPKGDLLRSATNSHALIPDHRNDENILVSAIHLTFQKFHNILVNKENKSYEEAKKAVTWHYQCVVAHDFVPKIVGDATYNAVQNKDNFKLFPLQENRESIFIPTEFSGACYRFGHSMVRNDYDFNSSFLNTSSRKNLFFGFEGGRVDSSDPLSHRVTDIWTISGNTSGLIKFFSPEENSINFAGLIDVKLPEVLFNLQVEEGESRVLPLRNITTGEKLQLPNGQQFSAWAIEQKGLNITPLTQDEISIADIPAAVLTNTPLWYYILKEAEIKSGGRHLGPLAGRLVAEVIFGMLFVDGTSVLNNEDATWPFQIKAQHTEITMSDIIEFVDANHDDVS